MSQWERNLYVLWLGVVIAGASFSLVTPFLPLLLNDVGVVTNVEFWSGLLFAASFVASSVMSPIWGSLADKYGKKPMIIRSGIGIGTTYLLMAFATNQYHLLALRFMNGVLSGFIPSSISLVATNTPEDRIGRSLGILQTGAAAGSILGPLFGGVLSKMFGNRNTLLVAAGVLFVATLVVTFGVKEEVKGKNKQRSNILADLKEAATNSDLMAMLVTLLMIQASVQILQPVLTLYVAKFGTGDNTALVTGVVFSAVGVATVIAAPLWGRYGEKVGFRRVLFIGLVGTALASIPQVFAGSVVQFGILRFIFGIFMAGVLPAANATIAAAVSPEFRGRAFGISNSFNMMGNAIGPMIGGIIGTWLGIKVVFLTTGVMMLLTALWVKTVLKAPAAAVQKAEQQAAV